MFYKSLYVYKGIIQMMTKDGPLSGKFYTVKEVAKALGVKERVILDLLRSGKKLRGVKIGKEWRIRESDLTAFLDGKKPG